MKGEVSHSLFRTRRVRGCAPQEVDPASIARFRTAMRGEYGGGDWTHVGAGPSWSGTTGGSMSTSRLAMRSTSGWGVWVPVEMREA